MVFTSRRIYAIITNQTKRKNTMDEILEYIVCVGILADDLHYRSSGDSFYANHLLADTIKKPLDGFMDDLREIYWLGELYALPPQTDVTYQNASMKAQSIRLRAASSDRNLGLSVKDALNVLIHSIENIKKEGALISGTVSVLDGICAHAQKMCGLLDRMLASA